MSSVRLSVCDDVYRGAQGRKLYSRVSIRALPVHFFKHFGYWLFFSHNNTLRKTEPPKFPRLEEP